MARHDAISLISWTNVRSRTKHIFSVWEPGVWTHPESKLFKLVRVASYSTFVTVYIGSIGATPETTTAQMHIRDTPPRILWSPPLVYTSDPLVYTKGHPAISTPPACPDQHQGPPNAHHGSSYPTPDAYQRNPNIYWDPYTQCHTPLASGEEGKNSARGASGRAVVQHPACPATHCQTAHSASRCPLCSPMTQPTWHLKGLMCTRDAWIFL